MILLLCYQWLFFEYQKKLEKRHNLSLISAKFDRSTIAQMEYVISIAKRCNYARTHYKDPRNRGIKCTKPIF
jgi:hypothetical protein